MVSDETGISGAAPTLVRDGNVGKSERKSGEGWRERSEGTVGVTRERAKERMGPMRGWLTDCGLREGALRPMLVPRSPQ